MGSFIIDQGFALISCLDNAVTSRGLLAANPLTAFLAAGFDGWITEWKAVFLQEIDHRIAGTSAAALEVSLDGDLNDLSDETSRTVLIYTKNNREDPEYVFYFNGERASDFKKPHMGSQLAAMTVWPPHMAASPHAPIINLGTRIAVKVKDAGTAIESTATAEQKAREFRLTGARRQLIDKLNALRKATYGILAEMPHKHPELKLPGNFADRFFPAERAVAPSRPPTAASLKLEMDVLQADLATLNAQYDKALQAEADEAASKAQTRVSPFCNRERLTNGDAMYNVHHDQERTLLKRMDEHGRPVEEWDCQISTPQQRRPCPALHLPHCSAFWKLFGSP
jgi:hypothetical protein